MINCPIFTAFKLAKNTGFELEQHRQRNACFAENFSAPKKQHQRNSPKVRNRKRSTQNENFASSATGANVKGTFDPV
ncbi:hypothetical protein AKH04_11170 [Vibrio parahaemolyticus]|nr:hypothetical protein AKH04_11170 [Vibrio parahaemolyticus]